MCSRLLLLVLIVSVVGENCYWNDPCSYHLFSSKTTYDAVRGDIRDFTRNANCEVVSLWSLNRHGNRNPGGSVTEQIKIIAQLKDQIVQSYEAGRSQLCAQDIELFRKWSWNETLEVSTSFLTGVGYEEIYDIAKRIRQTYPELLYGDPDDYKFRSTDTQRTITSGIAFIHGLTEGTNLSVFSEEVRQQDDVIRPYENCDKYQQEVKEGPLVTSEVADFVNSAEYQTIRNAVQQRLGIEYQLTSEDIYGFYEICRFHRSWEPDLKSPWCAAFTREELVVLEYRDDVRHYYRNGYGSWVNARLGALPLKDMYETLSAIVAGSSRKITAYFTHDTLMEMAYSALGIHRDEESLRGAEIQYERKWRSSLVASMAANLMFVLNRCQESGTEVYRVQVFNMEKETEMCPSIGCTWSEFQQRFQKFANASLDFCSLDYPEPEELSVTEEALVDGSVPDSAHAIESTFIMFLAQLFALVSFYR